MPWQPLEQAVIDALQHQHIDPNTVQQARLLNVSTGFIYQRRRDGTIRSLAADRFACQLGYHPSLIWGDLWWETAALEVRVRER